VTKTLVSEIHIDAPPRDVWDILSDLSSYQEWNPFITEAAGRVEPGDRLTLRMQPATGRAITLRPTVTAVRPGTQLRWLGRLVMPGLFDAEHTFLIEADGTGSRLVQRETFRGILTPFLARSLDRGTLPAFGLMNEALKRRAEQSVNSTRG
jgi:hypothetical protein